MTAAIPFDSPSEAELRRRIAGGSQNLDDYQCLVNLLVEADRYEEALTVFEQTLNLPLTNVERASVSADLGWILYEVIGKRTDALTLAESALSLLSSGPETPEVWFLRGHTGALLAHCVWFTDANAGAEAARRARTWLERVITESPEFEAIARAYYEAAVVHSLLGNAEQAVTFCQKSLRREGDNRNRRACLTVLTEALRLARRFREAKDAVEEALQDVGTDKGPVPRLYYTLGLIEREANHPVEALRAFEQARSVLQAHPFLHRDSDFLTDVHCQLADLHYETKDYPRAAAAFQQVLAHHPEDGPHHCFALLGLGHTHLATGAPVKARECYETVLASPQASEDQKASAREGLAALPPQTNVFQFLRRLIYGRRHSS